MGDPLADACSRLNVEVSRPLFEGGQKKVYIVTDAWNEQRVLKLIDLGRANDPAARERAHREVELLRSINHPNVVKVVSDLTEIGSPPHGAAWLEELLDGADLRHAVGSGWPEAQLIALGAAVAAGLGALHEKRVIHRDLSPGNIRCLSGGGFKVMDPGFAKHTLRSGVTVGGQPGTAGFMTPEHIQSYSGAPTPASDVFGCGALVYLAATGTPAVPYKGDDAEYIQRLRKAAHIPLQDLRADLSVELSALVEKTLHPQPARRFRNGRALAEAFEALR